MKKSLLMMLVLAMVFVAKVQGSPIDRTAALQQVRDFLQAKGLTISDNLRLTYSSTVMNSEGESVPAYYVFNNGDNDGYVILSGDGNVLGYSETGSFEMDKAPVQLVSLLEGYSERVSKVEVEEAFDYEETGPVGYRVMNTRTAVAPMLTSKWSQYQPYNGSCPVYKASTGDRCVIGCIPVAMAQMLYYHRDRNPSAITNDIPGYKKGAYTIETIPAGTPLDWNNILDSYTGLESDVQKKAVSDLMFYCGASLKTTYSASASSASFKNVASALVNYFGFHPATRMARRNDYTKEDWQNLIYDELVNGRPVVYLGSADIGTHGFVVDGFDGDQFYHINWGWGSMSDGYFLLTSCDFKNPESLLGSSSSGFNQFQYAIVNAQPLNGAQWEYSEPVLTAEIKSYDSSTKLVSTQYFNYNNEKKAFSFGYGIVTPDGAIHQVGTQKQNVELGIGGYVTLSYTIALSDLSSLGLSKGTHNLKLVPIFKLSGANSWSECDCKNDAYLEITYKQSSSPSISDVVMHPVHSLKATNFEFPGSCVANTLQPVYVTIENVGDDFADEVYLFASKTTTYDSYVSTLGLYLAPGEKTKVEFKVTPTSTGSWNFLVSTDPSGAENCGSATQTIYSGSTKKELAIESYTINGMGSKNSNGLYEVYGNALTGKVKIKNNGESIFSGTIAICIRQVNTPGSDEFTGPTDRYTLNLKPQESVEFDLDFRGLDYNVYWYKIVYMYSQTTTSLKGNPWTKYALVPGIIMYDNDGVLIGTPLTSTYKVPDNATAIDMTGLVGSNGITKVVPNGNPNTLYIVGSGDSTPSGLSGKNIVKGSTSSKISLADDFDYYSPVTFTAKKLEYSFTPTKAASGSAGWTTIALPFEVSSVTANGEPIDWFHSSNDSGKWFWVKKFVGENNGVVSFDYADVMEANKPYIMAVSGPEWGDKWNLVGKKLVFTGTKQTLVSGAKIVVGSDEYNFEGTTTRVQEDQVWALNDAGSQFVLGEYENSPFRAYFKAKRTIFDAPTTLVMDDTSGIMVPVAIEGETIAVYNINGIKVAEAKVVDGHVDLDHLSKGVYVVKGQKFVKY